MAHPRIALRCLVLLGALGALGACGGEDADGPELPPAAPSESETGPVPFGVHKLDVGPRDPAEQAAYAARQLEMRAFMYGRSQGPAQRQIPERLATLLETPKEYWAFLVDPLTTLPERKRAAIDAGKVLPLSWLPRVAALRQQLKAEATLHQWGRRRSPMNAVFIEEPATWDRVKTVLRDLPDAERRRSIAGHEWTVPTEPQGFSPVTWEERCAAPWPIQVDDCLTDLFRSWQPNLRARGSSRATPEQVDAWVDAVLALPMENVEDAHFVHQLAVQRVDVASIRALARFHAAVLDSRFEEAAGWFAEHTVNSARGSKDRDAGLMGQVILLDLWASEVPQKQKHASAYSIRSLALATRGPFAGTADHVWPASVLLDASRRGLDPAEGDAWSRLYCYLFSAAEAHPDPPFEVDRHADPDTAETWIEQYRVWFEAHEAALVVSAAAEAPELDRVRKRLESLR